jgi:hypothetical protein
MEAGSRLFAQSCKRCLLAFGRHFSKFNRKCHTRSQARRRPNHHGLIEEAFVSLERSSIRRRVNNPDPPVIEICQNRFERQNRQVLGLQSL